MVEILLQFLLLPKLLCPETKTDSLLSGRGHLQHAGSFPGEKKSRETKCIEPLLLHIDLSAGTEVVKQQAGNCFFSDSFQYTVMCTCEISYFSQ